MEIASRREGKTEAQKGRNRSSRLAWALDRTSGSAKAMSVEAVLLGTGRRGWLGSELEGGSGRALGDVCGEEWAWELGDGRGGTGSKMVLGVMGSLGNAAKPAC